KPATMFDEFKSAFQRPNNAHAQLIIINVVIFIVLAIFMVITKITGLEGAFDVVHEQFQIPARLDEFLTRPWTIITYAFAHDLTGILHILFNMLALYWFGRLFVEYLGSDKLVAVYVLGALFGGLFYLLAYNTIPFFVEHSSRVQIGMVGASAAVDAIVVATAVLLPNYTFFMLFLGPVKIKYIAAIVVFLSILGTVGSNAGGNIAHLGGALIGFIYIKQLQAGVNWGQWITVTIDWFKDLFKSKPKVKVTYRGKEQTSRKPSSPTANTSQAEIDIILDKISDRGYESLTKEEKEKLFNASKK
ncbi:MAG TPA: rhomboid family intramembrane serine protease, partial [Cyclobacteriaceae bacterium]|nr:rhomboid family intramembrane serine protease [Cyclobacteriaceae bacterium]